MNTLNPIIPGFSPDPSLVLVDGTYFLVNSSFHMYPGLPIYTSQDLVHWKQIGNAIDRPSQLSLKKSSTFVHVVGESDGLVATGGLYAPTLRHNNGTFYIVCTNLIHHTNGAPPVMSNFIISTTDIWGGKWSDPIPFDFYGIDPSLFFDADGKSFICGSAYPGPSTRIALFEIDLATGKKLSKEIDIWTGTGGIYPEGPHIYFHNTFYYVMVAEGGTLEDHMVTMARSKDIWGPYESCPRNPVLTARGTDEYVQCTGHCEAFEDQQGGWWGFCLGIRMKKKDEGRYVLGRETFLTKGNWSEDGWLEFDRVKMDLKIPGVKVKEEQRLTAAPGVDFLYIRDPELSYYSISDDCKNFELTSSPFDLDTPEHSPTFLGKRQRQLNGTSSVTITNLQQVGSNRDHCAGLAVYKDEYRFLRICYSPWTSTIAFEVRNKVSAINRSLVHRIRGSPNTLRLVLKYTDMEYEASYSVDGAKSIVSGTADTMDLSEMDFVGPIIGLFVTGEGGEVCFKDFEVA
ncbi:glycoside hydrolase family 43 protein [Dothidotthia symphoricarpi CBS 119687]|uniref:Glycoside hydrolase family 43 protein n=1 Tax=Dothidotthia symphoricarpi CBS 119687 TaxID=1392245 RepID=A0A6A6AAF2_9PLEO|nr:glycoside hydrolase family 43 protein [Dothidotthia symphoricarpi CBS 119687]KAF2128769.1 glycoside hydrolase family 43 protein [Dothidotthia symphoricarpi CBS 119687]